MANTHAFTGVRAQSIVIMIQLLRELHLRDREYLKSSVSLVDLLELHGNKGRSRKGS